MNATSFKLSIPLKTLIFIFSVCELIQDKYRNVNEQINDISEVIKDAITS